MLPLADPMDDHLCKSSPSPTSLLPTSHAEGEKLDRGRPMSKRQQFVTRCREKSEPVIPRPSRSGFSRSNPVITRSRSMADLSSAHCMLHSPKKGSAALVIRYEHDQSRGEDHFSDEGLDSARSDSFPVADEIRPRTEIGLNFERRDSVLQYQKDDGSGHTKDVRLVIQATTPLQNSPKTPRKSRVRAPVVSQYFATPPSSKSRNPGSIWKTLSDQATLHQKLNCSSVPQQAEPQSRNTSVDEEVGDSESDISRYMLASGHNVLMEDSDKDNRANSIPESSRSSAVSQERKAYRDQAPMSSLQTPPKSSSRRAFLTPRRSTRLKKEYLDDAVAFSTVPYQLSIVDSDESSSEFHEIESAYDGSIYSEPPEDFPVVAPKPKPRTKQPIRSAHFDSPDKEEKKRKARKAGRVSCIPFPPLDAPTFGLIQEELVQEPFWMIIVTIFLTLTTAKKAIPVFRKVKETWDDPTLLMMADYWDIFNIFESLGLYKRIDQMQELAASWCAAPPSRDARHRTLHYPNKGDGKDIKPKEILSAEDPRIGAWEIGHLTKGPYALDSWRIFCRDVFLGKADGWNGEGQDFDFEPEWMRVKPHDKELRAILRWMWLKEGFVYDAETGKRQVASRDLMEAAIEGRIGWENTTGDLKIVPYEEVESGDFVPRRGGDCEDVWGRWWELCARDAERGGAEWEILCS